MRIRELRKDRLLVGEPFVKKNRLTLSKIHMIRGVLFVSLMRGASAQTQRLKTVVWKGIALRVCCATISPSIILRLSKCFLETAARLAINKYGLF